MAKTRAYKIAEELGIDRNELVEKAQTFGIELRSAMAPLEEAEANLLREKLGTPVQGAEVEERRVERAGGAAVIRRRKRIVAEPEPPAPEPTPEPSVVASDPAPAEAPPAAPTPLPVETPPPLVAPVPAPVAQPPTQATAARAPAPGSATTPGPGASDFGTGPGPAGPAAANKGKHRKRVKEIVNLREQEQLARQVTGRAVRRSVSLGSSAIVSPRRRRRDSAPARPAARPVAKEVRRVVRVNRTITVADLAQQLGAKAAEVQGRLMALGTMATMHQALDLSAAGNLASQYGFEVQDVGFDESKLLEAAVEHREDAPRRPPVVTVMGHVDHGKTSLLDALRKTDVVAGEAGGITQHIGAYQVTLAGGKVTFLDTPGHEAFTALRARGAKTTDLVILVVAATEGIMPQTVEAIEHARAAGVPILVAVNKCDLPDADPRRCRERLVEHQLVAEEFGGDTICVDVSAKQGSGLDQLLEMVMLQAELLELRADPEQRGRGVVLESQLDRGRGVVATVLVQQGTLRRGDIVVAGTSYGRVRAMESERGERLTEALPASPVRVFGLSAVPEAGQALHAVESERDAREVVAHRVDTAREESVQARPKLSLEELFAQSEGGGAKELRVVLKADTHGSLEAVRDALQKLSTEAVVVQILLAGVGGISESDVMLAKASRAIVVGFHVRPDSAARRAGEGQGVDLRSYQIIYELTDEVRQAMAGLLPPVRGERVLGRVEVRKVFHVPRVGRVAGCYVHEGAARRDAQARLLRDGVQIWQGALASLKRFRDDTREVQHGFECGIGLEGYDDVKIGDIIEPYEITETPASLE